RRPSRELRGRSDRQHRGEARMSTGAAGSRRFDAVTLEVLWTRLISVVDEAAKAIVRTSFSTLSNEANDFACMLTDARGYSLAPNHPRLPPLTRTLAPPLPPLPAPMGSRRDATGRRPHHQRCLDGHRAHERRQRAQADLPRRPTGRVLGDHLAHARHRRAGSRGPGARGVWGGGTYPPDEGDPRGGSRGGAHRDE